MSGHTIHFVDEFTDIPGLRFRTDGQFSGEQFREDLLAPALEKHEVVTVDMTGIFAACPSFLDEAFLVMVWREGMSPDEFRRRVSIIGDDYSANRIQEVLANG